MKQRVLVSLLALSLMVQSVGIPVMGAEVSGNAIEREAAVPEASDTPIAEPEEEEGILPSEASEITAPDLVENEDTGTEEVTDENLTTELPEENGEEEDNVPQITEEALTEALADPVSDGETSVSANEGTVSENELDSKQEASEANIFYTSVPGGEGLYQEGALSIIEKEAPVIFTYSFRSFFSAGETKTAEEVIYEGLSAKAASINLFSYNIPLANIEAIFYGVVNDNPDLFFVRTGFQMSYTSVNGQNIVYAVFPVYLEVDEGAEEAFSAAVEEALTSVEGLDSELEKAIALHDYLAINCEYDYENLLAQNTGTGAVPARSFTAYGAFVDKIAVCQGYALAYKLLCNKVGIECYMVTSDALNHAWNLINIDGEYYQVDVTWDDPTWDLPGRVDHTNMFVSDSAFTNHWESGSSKGWEITRGSEVVNYVAANNKYDSAFWRDSDTPIIMEGDYFYYLNSQGTLPGIVKRNAATGEEALLYSSNLIGRWYVSGDTGGYWPGVFSGFFRLGNRLYYNTPKQICSIALDGSDYRAETDVLQTETGSVYSCVLTSDGTVKYVLLNSPNYSGKKTATEVTLQGAVDIPVKTVSLSVAELEMSIGGKQQLEVAYTPTNAVDTTATWTSSRDTVATVENGLVTAKGLGQCTITVTIGGKSADCSIIVKEKLAVPVFSPPQGPVDVGEEITLTAANGADIYYTLDSSEPVMGEGGTKKYESPIVLEEDTTIRAYAHSELVQYDDSDVAEITFQVYKNQLSLSASELNLVEGEEVKLELLEIPEGKTEADVRWSVDQEGPVEVDREGNVTALLAGTVTVTATTTDYRNRTVTAQCQITVKAPMRKVTYIGWGNSVITTLDVESRTKAPYMPVNEDGEAIDFIPDGYRLEGWLVQGEEGGEAKTTDFYIDKNTVVEAKYGLISYRLTYQNAMDGALLTEVENPENSSEYTVESETITLQAPHKEIEGKVFDGWYTEIDPETKKGKEGSRITGIPKGSTGDLTLYACWKVEKGLWIRDLEDTDGDAENTIDPREYTGKAIKPKLAVYYDEEELKAGRDYTLTYQNNTAATKTAKMAAVTIRLKGAYSGNVSYSFEILPKNIETSDVLSDSIVAAYNRGRVIKPIPTVTWQGIKLYHRKDFTLNYTGAKSPGITEEELYRVPGTYTIQIQGKGNYTGTKEIDLIIADPATQILMSRVKITGEFRQEYSGQPLAIDENMLQLTYTDSEGTHTLETGADYELDYVDGKAPTEIGSYKVKITGIEKGNGKKEYIGTRYVTFTIEGTNILTTTIDLEKERSYTGSVITFADGADEGAKDRLIVKDKQGNLLQKDVDYQIECQSIKSGLGKVVITGMGRYYGRVTKTFRILPADAAGEDDNSGTDSLPGGGSGLDTSTGGESGLAGSGAPTEEPKQLDLSGITIVVPDLVESTKAGSYRSTPILTDSHGKRLRAGVDYEVVDYRNRVGARLDNNAVVKGGNTLTVSVEGKGDYSGTLSADYRIVDKGYLLSAVTVTLNKDISYAGGRVMLAETDLKVTMGSTLLTVNDYRIKSIRSNGERGNAVIILEGIGDYAGTRQVTIKIAAEEISSVQ